MSHRLGGPISRLLQRKKALGAVTLGNVLAHCRWQRVRALGTDREGQTSACKTRRETILGRSQVWECAHRLPVACSERPQYRLEGSKVSSQCMQSAKKTRVLGCLTIWRRGRKRRGARSGRVKLKRPMHANCKDKNLGALTNLAMWSQTASGTEWEALAMSRA